jgi:hypothetical protein
LRGPGYGAGPGPLLKAGPLIAPLKVQLSRRFRHAIFIFCLRNPASMF